jgi:hypothetical protein
VVLFFFAWRKSGVGERVVVHGSVLQLSLPSTAAYYNDDMNAVDITDHLQSNIRSDHRQRRGPGRTLTWSFLLVTAPLSL